ncbi:ATP-dependent RecD-like DNA helicase [Bacillus sp. FJAT-22090]|uniref:ATP-dependent RecD-like DNA helicase n=1 Tax=Bacillus sp. FJAT-22090 TaxID=1581038 RepID=UPI0021B15F0C|nr:ATP-dependent RecD-like DNA helicase [Bacillus sp. FJAT-22090]
MKQYELEVSIQRQVYYDESKMFGIFACDTVEYNREVVKNKYGNFSIQGNTRPLTEGEKYTIKFEGAYSHPKYGEYYKIIEVEMDKLDTLDAQDKFLKEVISEKHFNVLKKTYPHEKLVDFILADKVNVQLTKGIKQPTLNKIKQNIQDNMKLANLIAKLSELDISTSKLYKILEHFQTPDVALTAIETEIYQLCDIKTFGFKTVDEIAMRRGDSPESKKRIEACIKYQLKQDTNEGHTWSVKSLLLTECSDLLNLPMGLVESTLANMHKAIVFQNDNQVALASIRKLEYEVFNHLKRISENYTPPKIENIEHKLKETEEYQGFEFTDEQRKAIIEGSQYGVMILNGVAGSGKSANVKGLIDSLGTSNYMTCALSGKAVNVLSQRGIEASTIHRMLGFQDGAFIFNEHSPLPYSVVVIDEVSMINVQLIHSVISAVPNGAKLIIVGDSGQLPAIGYGDVLRDLLATSLFPKFELTKVHRQAAKSGILSLANSIRNGNQVFNYDTAGQETFGELQDQTVIAYHNKESIINDLLEISKAYKSRIYTPEDLYEFQVIVANRERGSLSVKNLNIELQAIFNDMNKTSLNRNGYDYREGDKIITQGNAYKKLKFHDTHEYHSKMAQASFMEDDEAEYFLKPYRFDLFNGTLGYIDSFDKTNKLVFIRLDGYDGVVALNETELDKIEMAYAATVHKLQGSSIKNVIFALDYGAYKLLSKQLVYTAMTRTSLKGVALVENNALYAAIKNDASGMRRTFLGEIINSQSQHK